MFTFGRLFILSNPLSRYICDVRVLSGTSAFIILNVVTDRLRSSGLTVERAVVGVGDWAPDDRPGVGMFRGPCMPDTRVPSGRARANSVADEMVGIGKVGESGSYGS